MKISECKVGMVIGSTGNPFYMWEIIKINDKNGTIDVRTLENGIEHIGVFVDFKLYEIDKELTMKRITVYSAKDKGDMFEIIGTYHVPQCTEIIVINHVIYKVDDEFPDEAYPAKVTVIQ